MRTILLSVAALSLSASVVASDPSTAERAEQPQTVRVHSVDMKGKPPFKRSSEVLSVQDAAALEESQEAGRNTAPKGRPPFNRNR